MTKIIFLFILKAVFVTVSYSANNLIETTCKRISYLDLYVSTLKPSPEFDRSHKRARLHLVDIVNAKASGTLNRILKLLKSVKDRRLRKAALIHITPFSRVIEAIEKGNLKFAIKSAINAGNKDQGGVGEVASLKLIDSLLTKMNSRSNDKVVELVVHSSCLDPYDNYKVFRVEDNCKLMNDFYSGDFMEQEKLHVKIQLEHFQLDAHQSTELQKASIVVKLCQ
ncbi:hypothetical protein Gogos_003618, partial [Gossypium gossypioides]|nr:hypothetical protein [Gossypium gossypioides]